MPRLLSLLLLLTFGAAATRIRDVASDEASVLSSQETLAARRVAASGALGCRFHLQWLLHTRKAAGPGNDLPSGSPLSSERYAAPKRLGHGACGESWKAWDRKLNRTVVVKIASSLLTGAYSRKGDFEAEIADKECRIMQQAAEGHSSYPEGRRHLCTCLESHATEEGGGSGAAFIVLEFCGTSLDDLQKPQELEVGSLARLKGWVTGEEPKQLEWRSLSLPDVRRWMLGSLRGLRFLAEMTPPLAHGDVHQGNIVVTDDNEAKLIDFGFSEFYRDGEERWKHDVTSWGLIYGNLLCSPASLMTFGGQERSMCAGDSLGIGTKEDWRLVDMAMAPSGEPPAMNVLMAHFP